MTRPSDKYSAARPLRDPQAIVGAFLTAIEARDLSAARAHLGDRFEMVFPGGVYMTDVADLIAWSRPRYQRVAKSYCGWDVAGDVVWCRGTLSGVWPDGRSFEGIRFVDRFELSDGRIVRQEVWNDMGEHCS